MQLSASIPTLDPSLAGLLLGVGTPTATSTGEGVPPSAGEGFADVLANVATPAASVALTPPEALAALTASLAAPISTSSGLPVAALPFAPNLRLATAGDVGDASLIETAEPESAKAAVTTDVTMAAIPSDAALEVDPLVPESDPTQVRGITPRDENGKKPAEEAIAMALACVPQPLVLVAPETSQPTFVAEKAGALADTGAAEEGSNDLETTAVSVPLENQGARFSERSDLPARFASASGPAAPARFAPLSNRAATRGLRAAEVAPGTEPAAAAPAASQEIPVENGDPVAAVPAPLANDSMAEAAALPVTLGLSALARQSSEVPTGALERKVAGSRPAPTPMRDESFSRPSLTPPQDTTFTALPSATPKPLPSATPIPTAESTPASTPDLAATPDAELLAESVPLPVTPTPVARTQTPATQPDTAELSDDAAKIAVETEFAASRGSARETPAPRNFVATTVKQLTSRPAAFGTSIAKPADAMPFAQTSTRSALADFQPASLVLDRGSDTSDVSNASPTPAPEAMSTAHRAVEAVLTAVQRFSIGERHAVSLQFAVGDADLRVRVEMRNDEVHATFRTDSAELRTALSHEWNSANASAGDRPFRLATPVFTSNDASSFSAPSGDQASQQQRQQRESAAQPANDPFAVGVSRSRGARESAAASAPVSSAALRPALSTTRHLHTLA